VAPDLDLQRKEEEERSEDLEKRSRSLIEKGVRGSLIWLRRPKSRSGSTTIDWGGYMSADLPLWKITSQ
jgi:hypothetical protein